MPNLSLSAAAAAAFGRDLWHKFVKQLTHGRPVLSGLASDPMRSELLITRTPELKFERALARREAA